MKKIYFYLLIALTLLPTLTSSAQSDPGTANLTHQWTFDNGFATDLIGNRNGTLIGGATITNKSLNTSEGGYLSFPAADLGINNYSSLTTELWFKSAADMNPGNTMLSYFGDANLDGSLGANYIYTSPSNGGNCRVAISTGNTTDPWTTETVVNSTGGAIDDGQLHHLVSVTKATTVTLYVDGVNVGSTPLSEANTLSGISTAKAFLCKSGYTNDPTWKGIVHKYSIYNKVLSADEVLFLYQQGAESSTSIDVSKSSLSFDEINTTDEFTVTGSNLTDDITLEAPAGITLSAATLAADVSNAAITVSYNGSTEINGEIILTSGSTIMNIPIKAAPNTACFSPLYSNLQNLIPDPFMNSITDSWGNVKLASGADVYCGSRCVKITGKASCWPDGGSVGTKNITWLPNTSYRFHAKIKTMDGTFNMGVQNANVGGINDDYNITVPNTLGNWEDFDATFTTGPSPSPGVAFFNNCGLASGLIGYIDNWELYALPGISTSVSEISVDEFINSTSFKITGVGLTESILITTPPGITVDQDVQPADASEITVNISYDGTSAINGDIVLTSGSFTKIISVTASKNEDCFIPLCQDAVNLISDPYLSDLASFSGSGTRSINTDPRYAYCGVSSGKVSGSGSIEKDLTGVMKPNTTYRIKAMVYKKNPGNVTYTLAIDSTSNPTAYDMIKTAMDSACWYFNQYTPFDAHINVYYNAGISTAQADYYGSIGFGPNQRYMWVGTAIHEMDHYFGSGTSDEWHNLMVNGAWTGAEANKLAQSLSGSNIYGDSQHFWPYGINQKEEITNLGDLATQEKGLIDAVKIAKAMLVDDSDLVPNMYSVGIGVYGWDVDSSAIYHEATSTEEWQDIDFIFTTGENLENMQGVYFNSGSGYIDNWEMYEVSVPTAISQESIDAASKIYLANDKIISEIYLQNKSDIDISVYDLNGKLLIREKSSGGAGENRQAIKAPLKRGLYIVKIVTSYQTISEKIVK